MQRINDADHIATYSDSTYPVGPDTSGEITYVHVPPLGPLSIIVTALSCVAVAAFIWCYLYPLVRKWHSRATGKTAEGRVKQPVLASARSLFSLRSQRTTTMTTTTTPPTTPQQLLVRYGQPDMRMAKPQAAVSLSRGSSFLPSLSSSSSSSPSPSPSPPSLSPPLETPLMYALPSGGIPRIIVAPVDVGILGQIVGSRDAPKKGGDYYDGHGADDNE